MLIKKIDSDQVQKPKSMFRIKVIDQNEILLNLLNYELEEKEGYSVSGSVNSAKFLESDEAAPDLILTDLILEGVNGFEFIEAFRNNKKFSSTRIIILSEKLNESEISHLRKLEVDDIIEKPIKIAELLFRIEKIRKG